MANNQSIPECSHQQRQCKQIYTPLDSQDSGVVPPRRLSFLLRCTRSERTGASAEGTLAEYKDGSGKVGTIRGGGQCRGTQRLSHARRGNQKGNRRISISGGDGLERSSGAGGTKGAAAVSRQIQTRRHNSSLRDGALTSLQRDPNHGSPAPHPAPPAEIRVVEAETADDGARQSWFDSDDEHICVTLGAGRVPAATGCPRGEARGGVSWQGWDRGFGGVQSGHLIIERTTKASASRITFFPEPLPMGSKLSRCRGKDRRWSWWFTDVSYTIDSLARRILSKTSCNNCNANKSTL
jgi:hypothetical protein